MLSIEPFLGGGVRPEGSIDPPPPGNENPASLIWFQACPDVTHAHTYTHTATYRPPSLTGHALQGMGGGGQGPGVAPASTGVPTAQGRATAGQRGRTPDLGGPVLLSCRVTEGGGARG